MHNKPEPNVLDFKITCYRNLLKLQYWLAQYNIPISYTNTLPRVEVFMLKDIVEEDLKRSEQ